MPTLGDLARVYHNGNLTQTADADLLAMLQKYDPNARYLDTGPDNGGYAFRLDYDPSKLPQNAVNKERGTFGTVPVYDNGEYFDSRAFKQDDNYGRITDARNFKPESNVLETMAPYIGAAIGGGAGLLGGGMSSLASLGMKAPSLARAAAGGNWLSLLSAALTAGAPQVGLPSWSGSALNTLGSIARRKNG